MENSTNHVIWFENNESITMKMNMIMNKYGINKFSVWRIGAENPDLWNKLNKQRFQPDK
jgi:spore germination protein YaaH